MNALEAEIAKLDTSSDKVRTSLVAAKTIQPQLFEHYVEVEATVESDNQARVSTTMGGSIVQLSVREGQVVTAGTLIAEIDHSMVDKQIQEVETRLELAETNYERRKRLWDQEVGSEMQYLQAKNNKESLDKNLAVLKEQRSKYFVKAPIGGEVDEVFPQQGEFVGPGSPIVRIVGTGQYKLIANLSESYAGRVKNGDRVKVDLPDLDKQFMGTIRQVGEQINPMSRTFEVEVRIAGTPKLKPNMIAFVSINDYSAKDAILIPRNVVKGAKGGDTYVYIAERRGERYIAKQRPITIGQSYDEKVEVVSGLKKGDVIVTTGYQELTPGVVLKIDQMKKQPAKAVETDKETAADQQPPKQPTAQQ